MTSLRTVHSMAQFLELQNPDHVVILLDKHGLDSGYLAFAMRHSVSILEALVRTLEEGVQSSIRSLLEEIASTSGNLRSRVRPHLRYDERLEDLSRCLALDGYLLRNGTLIAVDPSVEGTPPLDDDLTSELRQSSLTNIDGILDKLAASVEAFCTSPPNYNSSLNDARIAMQTLATEIARHRLKSHPADVELTKWGAVIAYLRASEFISLDEERGLAGVFSFVSPGSHRPFGLTDAETVRLGRTLVAGMCWFLIKRFRAME